MLRQYNYLVIENQRSFGRTSSLVRLYKHLCMHLGSPFVLHGDVGPHLVVGKMSDLTLEIFQKGVLRTFMSLESTKSLGVVRTDTIPKLNITL